MVSEPYMEVLTETDLSVSFSPVTGNTFADLRTSPDFRVPSLSVGRKS